MAIADVAVALSLTPEIWTYHASNWIFGSGGCVAYRGLIVLATTVTSYLISTVALHTLATVNLEEKELMRTHRRNDNEEDEEIRSSRHSLVAASDSSTPPRTMNFDYRESKTSIPIKQPTIFVWILSISLSVPDFALATTVELNQNALVCTIIDSSQRLHLYSVLALLNLTLPILLMCVVLMLVIEKLRSKKRILLDQCESIAALKLSLWLIVMYLMMGVPRSALTAYNIYFTSIMMSDTFIVESIQQNNTPIMGMSFSCIYLATVLLRPIFSVLILPSVKRALSYGHRNINNV